MRIASAIGCLALLFVIGSSNATLVHPVGPLMAEDSHQGIVVSAGMKQLTVKLPEGKQHTYNIGDDTKITIHGMPGKLEDLMPGMSVIVIATEDNKALSVSTVDKEKIGHYALIGQVPTFPTN